MEIKQKITESNINDAINTVRGIYCLYEFNGNITIEWPKEEFELLKDMEINFRLIRDSASFSYMGITHKEKLNLCSDCKKKIVYNN